MTFVQLTVKIGKKICGDCNTETAGVARGKGVCLVFFFCE